MSDLISRQDAIRAVMTDVRTERTDCLFHANMICKRIDDLPSAGPEIIELVSRSYTDGFDDGYKQHDSETWIPCSEKLPEKDGITVLVTTENAEVYIDQVITDGFGERYFMSNTAYDNFEVIAWMPLPEPYRGEQ